MFEQLKKYASLGVVALLLVGVGVGYWKYRAYQSELARLRNELASKDKTVEELKNTYTKLATENDNLKSSSAALQKLLNKTRQDLIAETQATVYWKGRYEYVLNHHEGGDGGFKPGPEVACTEQPKSYIASQDLGLVEVTVETYTRDPGYQQRLLVGPGGKPLRLTLDLTRDQNKQWHSHVVSSDDRVGVDIAVASVNMAPLDLHWYEKIKIHLDFGAGTGGVLAGTGLTYQIGQFDVGPTVWGSSGAGLKPFYGLSLSWAPFKSRD